MCSVFVCSGCMPVQRAQRIHPRSQAVAPPALVDAGHENVVVFSKHGERPGEHVWCVVNKPVVNALLMI